MVAGRKRKSFSQIQLKKKLMSRVVLDTDLAGYPTNNFAGYRISSQPDNRISG